MKRAGIILIALFIIPLFGCASSFLNACRHGKIDRVKKYLENNTDINLGNSIGKTPLILAAENGQLEVVKLLLDKGADINLIDAYGWSALYEAVSRGELEISSLLIERGADINSCQPHYASTPYTPLISAINGNNLSSEIVQLSKIVQLLVNRGADVNARCYGMTAVKAANKKVVYLEKLNKNIVKEPIQFGWTIGISSKEGKIDQELVRQKRNELTNAPVPPTKLMHMEKCFSMVGIPNSCTGEVMQFSESSLPVMGGEDCIICNPLAEYLLYHSQQSKECMDCDSNGVHEKCFDNNGKIPCQQAGKPFSAQDNGDGTVTDFITGLMWKQRDAAYVTQGASSFPPVWQKAIDHCDTLIFAGHSDWRLPTKFELHSIVDHSRSNPAINPIFLCPPSHFWSATTNEYDTGGAWFVDFYNGYDGRAPKFFFKKVRCVRGP